jgi:hypothetical protein
MNPDRRGKARKLPDTLIYCQLEGDEGGAVLNISQGGLCFESFAPVEPNRLIHFWFSFDLKNRIEALGRLAWLDSSRKHGGLSFLALSQHARESISAWMGQTDCDETPATGDSSVTEPAFAASSAPFRQPNIPQTLVSQMPPTGATTVTPPASLIHTAGTESQAAVALRSLELPGLVPIERYRTAIRRQFVRGAVLGIFISAAVAWPVFKYTKGTNPSGSIQAAPISGAQTASPSPAPISTSAITQDSAISSATRKSQPSMTATYSPNNPPETTLARHKLQSQESSTRYQAAESAGRPALADSKRSKKISATPQQLWASVQAGNSKAAVALADLYIRGEGVPVNCDQARVLLLVASEKNNAEAIQKLRDLDKTDCPATPH